MTMKRKSLLLSSIMCILFSSFSQESVLIHNTQIRFWLKPVLMNSIKFKHYGEKIVKSYPFISYEAGFGLKQRLYENFSVNIDAGYTTTFFHIEYDYFYSKNLTYGQYKEKYFEYIDGLFVFPISIQYETLRMKKLNYFAELGIKISLHTNRDDYAGFGIGGDSYDSTFNFNLRLEALPKQSFVSYFIKAGLVFTTKKTHTFNLALVANYCPQPAYKGYYIFSNTPFESYGDVSLGFNYIGLEFAFGLTVHRKNFFPRKIEL